MRFLGTNPPPVTLTPFSQQHLRLRLMLAGLGQLGHHVVLGVVVGRGGVAHDAGLLVALRDVLCLLCVAGQSRG